MTDRGPFDGVCDVARFNWPTYVAATAAACGLAASKASLVRLAGTGLCAGIIGSLAAVHVAYDRSGLYELDWLPQLSRSPRTVVLHAGLDDVSKILSERHSIEHVVPVDIFEHSADSEASILRARQARPATGAEPKTSASLPSAGKFDLALGFLSLHELRTSEKRVATFEQAKTSLAPDGRLVIVEHMRDLPNVLAFGWGALHFFTRSTWVFDLECAGFQIENEQRISPFIRVLTAKPEPWTRWGPIHYGENHEHLRVDR